MTDHTPGPWLLNADGAAVYISNGTNDEPAICHCRYLNGAEIDSFDEAVANARLIAAAPETAAERDRLREANTELLAALKRLCSHFAAFTNDQRGGWGNQADAYYCLAKGAQDSWKQAHAAIAKHGEG